MKVHDIKVPPDRTCEALFLGDHDNHRLLLLQNPYPHWAYDHVRLALVDNNGTAYRIWHADSPSVPRWAKDLYRLFVQRLIHK